MTAIFGPAVMGLAYDGLDLQRTDLNIMFALSEGMDTLPQTRGADHVLPFRSGRVAAPYLADRRAVVATGWIAGAAPAPEASYRAYLDALKAKLDPTGLPRVLAATLADGTVRWIYCVCRNIIGGEMIGGEFRPLSIEWDALDPYWYSAYGTLVLDSGYILDDGEFLDAGGEIVVVPPITEVTFSSIGTAPVERIRVRFVGPSTGSVGIENVLTPDLVGFTVAQTLGVGERITVDNYARTARRDLGANLGTVRGDMTLRDGNAHGEYLSLAVGQNTLRILGGAAATHIRFYPTWL